MQLSIDITCEPLETLAAELTQIRRILAHQAGWPSPPNPTGSISFRRSGDENMARIFATLPQVPDHPEAGDVVSGELSYSLDGAEPTVVATALGQTEVDLGEVADDTAISASFVFIDDAGNRSATPLVASYTVADLTPPPDAVDGLGFRRE
jgi:hypothetical protein